MKSKAVKSITQFKISKVGICHRLVNTGIYNNIKAFKVTGWYESEQQENSTDAV